MNVEARAATLTVLTDREEISAAQARFRGRVEGASSRTGELQLGFQGGARSATTYYVQAEEFWGAFEELETRYWTAFGSGIRLITHSARSWSK